MQNYSHEPLVSSNSSMVGVLGGMGPEATVAFMQKIIEITPAEDDIDHVHLLVDQNSKVPSRIKALTHGDAESPGPAIAAMAQRLEQAGCTFLVMPCNTAHFYWRDAQDAVDIPVWHIVELTLERIAESMPGARLGMLCSPVLRKIGLYEGLVEARGLSLVYPRDEALLLDVIRAVKRGQGHQSDTRDSFIKVAKDVQAQGIDVMVLACTELSIIQNALSDDVPIIDTVTVLAEAVAAAAS